MDHLATLVDTGVDLDLDRVVVAGHSAGGQLALWSGARTRPQALQGPVRVLPQGVAGLGAVLDLARAHDIDAGNGAVAEFLGTSPDRSPERYAAASPFALLPLGVDQLIVHGSADTAVPVERAKRYASAAAASGNCIEYVEVPDGGHMDFLDPASNSPRNPLAMADGSNRTQGDAYIRIVG